MADNWYPAPGEHVERERRAEELRREAAADRAAAERYAETNPTYAGYLERWAQHKRRLADSE